MYSTGTMTSTRRVLTKMQVTRGFPSRHLSIIPRIRLSLQRNDEQKRERLVILGTGWGSYSVLKKVDKKLYDVIVISPRNHFLFTPLLASTTVGTLEFRSIIEPVRYVAEFSSYQLL